MSDSKIEQAINSKQIQLGSTKEEVSKAGVKPLYYGCVKHKRTNEDLLELWDFSTRLCSNNINNKYAFFFKDGELIEIREIKNENDLELD